MAKSLKNALAETTDIFDTIANSNTQGTQNTPYTESTPSAYYRFNLKMPMEYKEHLQKAAFRESTPSKVVTITEYICKLIKTDMDNNPQGSV